MRFASQPRTLILASALAILFSSQSGFPQGAPVSPEAQPLHILVGKSVIINLQARLKRVLASNPKVIQALVTSPTQVVVEAESAGTSSLILWDESGSSRMLDVHADLDLAGLRTAIQKAYPNQSIQAQSDEGRIILSGVVKNQAEQDDLAKMAGIYSKEVVNSLASERIPQKQILLEVRFAEVDRTKLQQLGINIFSTGATNTVGVISTQQFGPITGQGTGGGLRIEDGPVQYTLSSLLNIFLFRPDIHLGMTLQDLEQKSVLQILAQPNLMALDGQKASFLAGGEFPFPIVQGGANVGAVTIQFRPFGVRLDFTGHVTSENTVRLQVAPEVSTLDFANAVTISGFTVPAISTRRAETEVELRDGQSFGIAGLLDQRAQAQLSKVPGIGDIPILGQLFRSKSTKVDRSELVVLVTPHIVDPVGTGAQMNTTPKPAMPFLQIPKYDQDVPGNKGLENPSQPPPTQGNQGNGH
jgi:pilus assembly protein CpaC